MKRFATLAFAAAFLAAGLGASAAQKSAAELEKEKALAYPYANDLGPDKLPDEVLKSYPKGAQDGYALLQKKCTVCHTASRPLNSQFVETDGKDGPARDKAAKDLLAKDPSFAKEPFVWQVEGGIWQRYVKRMMSKPGCDISKDDGKKIWEFVAHDSRARKLGANKAKWEAQRKKLLEEFQAKHPARYETLYGKKH